MFTGLVEAVGEITEVKPTPGGLRLRLEHLARAGAGQWRQPRRERRLPDGGRSGSEAVHVDVSPETARVTTLGSCAARLDR